MTVPHLSPSIAHVLEMESPLHAWTIHRLLGNKPRKTTDEQEEGRLLHTLILEGDNRKGVVECPFPDFRTKEAKAMRDEARAMGKIPIVTEKLKAAEYTANRIAENIFKHGYRLASTGNAEQRVRWTEETPDGTANCSGILDWLRDDSGLIIDLKTTGGSAHPIACAAALLNSAGIIQEVAYRRAIEQAKPELAGRVQFHFLFAQTSEPYAVTPVICDGTMQEIGTGRWTRACEKWARCLATNEWPAYVQGPVEVSAPGWALQREMLSQGEF